MFQKAVKTAAKLRLAFTGTSGSGKTYTALTIAQGIANGKPIALVDTENGSASKYADKFDFDVAEMHAPFNPEKYIKAISEAAEAGYGVIILDSLSHAWMGTGGVLDLVDEAAKRSKSGNTYMAWKEGTPIQNRLIEAIVQSPIHVIATMRSKSEYVLETNANGKQAPKKVGLAAIQREGFEYEFDIVIQMTQDNDGIVEKSRCSELANRVFSKPGKEVSNILVEWLGGTVSPRQPQPPVIAPTLPVPPTEKKEEKQPVAPYPAEWKTPADAQKWAIDNKYCSNEFEAKASFKNSLKEVTGQDKSLDSNHLVAVLESFHKKHTTRQKEQLKEAA